MRRIMIAGTNSGCGKTTVVCAVLQALVNRGLRAASFKCGPDYIDPMFHEKIIGAESHNLDGYFCDRKMLRRLITDNSAEADISVVEGVMGFYDGIAGRASSHALSLDIDCPAVIVIDCKGMSASIGAVMHGFLNFRKPNRIAGFIFNRLPAQLVPEVRAMCDELHTGFFGYFPASPESALESRRLGLVTPDGVEDLKRKTQLLAEKAEQSIDIDGLIAASEMPPLDDLAKLPPRRERRVKIAAAKDSAFSFLYRDNMRLLERLGAEIQYFSPLDDTEIPRGAAGLILCGGYPELYAERLSQNRSMLDSVRKSIAGGMPVIAECGGFMYLHESLTGEDGTEYPMAGVIPGRCFSTSKLQRFGYVKLHAKADSLLCEKGGVIPAHEFHYWDSENCGSGFKAVKESSGKQWDCVHAKENMYAGFPHLYFYANLSAALRFVEACHKYGDNNDI